jgi:ribosomal protein S18 acetylase RimI-like enzyme
MAEYQVRQMRREEMDLAIDWAAAAGWNPGQDDAGLYYDTDPRGFFVGTLDDVPIASVSGVAYGDTFGFIGFHLVKPEFRGRGYGIQLWRAAMDYLGARTIGIDGMIDQQENYRRSGFELAWRNIRYEGMGVADERASSIVPIEAVDQAAVMALDRSVFPADRSDFIRRWIAQRRGRAYAAVKDGSVAGFGVIRECRRGYKIGPLTAVATDVAEDLFDALAAEAPGEPIFLDVPEASPEALALALRHGMQPVFETARMYTREVPKLALDRVFGVASFELG